MTMVYSCISFLNLAQLPLFLLLWFAKERSHVFVVFKYDDSHAAMVDSQNSTLQQIIYLPYEVSKNNDCCLLFSCGAAFTACFLWLSWCNENQYGVLEASLEQDWKGLPTEDGTKSQLTLCKIFFGVYLYIFYYLFLFMTLCTENLFAHDIYFTDEHIKCWALTKFLIIGVCLTPNPVLKRNAWFTCFVAFLFVWFEWHSFQEGLWSHYPYILAKVVVWGAEGLLLFGHHGDEEVACMTSLYSSLIFTGITLCTIQTLSAL